jgi:hypothetical protein
VSVRYLGGDAVKSKLNSRTPAVLSSSRKLPFVQHGFTGSPGITAKPSATASMRAPSRACMAAFSGSGALELAARCTSWMNSSSAKLPRAGGATTRSRSGITMTSWRLNPDIM